jgi:hypothetical protein
LRCSRRTPKCTTTSSLYVARREYMHACICFFFPDRCMFSWVCACAHHQGPRDAGEEAVQDSQHHHGERAVPGADAGGQGGRHARDQRRQPGAVQRHHPLVRNTPFVVRSQPSTGTGLPRSCGPVDQCARFCSYCMVCAGTASGR